MLSIVSLLVVVVLSVVIVRVGGIALRMTGLSADVASFQALSAFSGAGFTTSESEGVVSSPSRRAVLKTLIRLGSAGTVTAVGSLILGFAGEQKTATSTRIGVLVLGLAALWAFSRSAAFERLTTPLIVRVLRRTTTLELRDYAGLLHLRERYRVGELPVRAGEWLQGRTLRELDLPAEGVTVLGVEGRGGEYVGSPPPGLKLREGDRVLAYGREERLDELAERHAHDAAARERAVAEQQSVAAAEDRRRSDAAAAG